MSQRSITAAELARLVKAGDSVDVIDVRTPAEFREIHLAIARNVPLDRLDPMALIQSRDGGAARPLYVLCRSGDRGERACNRFYEAGFPDVFNVEGGMSACLATGLPAVQGKKAMSLERQVRIAAGSLVLIGVLLALSLHPAFLGISAFVGAGLVFAGITDTCGMGILLGRMPWNNCRDGNSFSCSIDGTIPRTQSASKS